jgi:ABC-type lipoprotein export system ATPase subunit
VEESRRLDTEFIDKALAISQHVESAGIFEEDVLERVAALDDLRSRYVASGLLDVTPRRTVVSGLNVAQLALLQVHFETEHQKLILLEDIQQRMELLLELANAKFPDKRLSIDRSKGFVIKSRRGDVIPLHLLSSGEQHEIALLYRLLFQTPANTLVMIDEPEISLHTTWQQQFIDDLLRIAEITHCQYVVATHSPDLVGNHADMMIGLGD